MTIAKMRSHLLGVKELESLTLRIATALVLVRLLRDENQTQFATALGVAPKTLAAWEAGRFSAVSTATWRVAALVGLADGVEWWLDPLILKLFVAAVGRGCLIPDEILTRVQGLVDDGHRLQWSDDEEIQRTFAGLSSQPETPEPTWREKRRLRHRKHGTPAWLTYSENVAEIADAKAVERHTCGGGKRIPPLDGNDD